MKKSSILLIVGFIAVSLMFIKKAFAGEPAVYDPRNWPSILGEYNNETKRIKATSTGELKVNASGSVDVSGSTVAVNVLNTPNVNALQSGDWLVTNKDFERQQTQSYKSQTILTAPTSVSVTGTGLSWIVKINGGIVEFNVNGGDTITLSDGEGIGDDFNFTNPSINITSITSGATAYTYIRYR